MFQSTYTWIQILQHLTFEINYRKWGVELLISEITTSILDYPILHKKKLCLVLSLPTYLLNMVSTAQTLPQIKSQEIIGHIEQHFMSTSPLYHVRNNFTWFIQLWSRKKTPLRLTNCNIVLTSHIALSAHDLQTENNNQ